MGNQLPEVESPAGLGYSRARAYQSKPMKLHFASPRPLPAQPVNVGAQ
jgi:hypothetical protein